MVMLGDGGWFLVAKDPGLPAPRVYLRLAPVGNRLRVVELYVDGEGRPLAAMKIGDRQLSRLEAQAVGLVNQHDVTIEDVAPDVAALVSHVGSSPASVDWIAAAHEAKRGGRSAPRKRMPRVLDLEAERLDGPPEALDDAFLRKVAGAYTSALLADRNPAQELAGQARVPVRTVHRWVYMARKRGIMPPGRRGVAG